MTVEPLQCHCRHRSAEKTRDYASFPPNGIVSSKELQLIDVHSGLKKKKDRARRPTTFKQGDSQVCKCKEITDKKET